MGLVPDFVVRRIIRVLLRQRLREIDYGSFEANHAAKMQWIEQVRARETIADATDKANEQHYEVPTKFILSTLGPYSKYSSCLYPTGQETLAEAEIAMLEGYCVKAQLKDGQEILDLGCGICHFIPFMYSFMTHPRLGQSFHVPRQGRVFHFSTLSPHFMTKQKYPNSRITGLSNSSTQKAYIDATAKSSGLFNLTVRTLN
ncbi:hypothetical protein C0991_003151 [Blastosporella zonata]|nr:hypothetical protein C0991_003151 [Blastosporella zonata]